MLGLLDRAGRPASDRATGAQGFGWDRADGSTRTWWPQGLALADDILLAAWYARDRRGIHTGTRVSVVDLRGLPAPRYAHVRLVDRDGGPVRVHAGGLARWGDHLLVADTRRGVRIFDVDDVYLVPGPRRSARLVLSQRTMWRACAEGGVRPLRWSFLSVDATDAGGPALVAGEYARQGAGARLARWSLDPATAAPARESPDEVLTPAIASMQGAVRVRGTWVVSSSDGRRRGHLWTGTAGTFTRHDRALPAGPEDLAYDPTDVARSGRERVWTQTEHPRRRLVLPVAVPVALPVGPPGGPGPG